VPETAIPMSYNTLHEGISASSPSEISGSDSGEYEDGCPEAFALCTLVEVRRCFTGTSCLHPSSRR
jgi:hypothetical protein